MAHDDVWRKACAAPEATLCLDCLGKRLGRRIVADDLTLTPPEILGRFSLQEHEPLSPDERQRELECWRAWRRKVMQAHETDDPLTSGDDRRYDRSRDRSNRPHRCEGP